MSIALAVVADPPFRSYDRLAELDRLEMRLLGRMNYHRRTVTHLTVTFEHSPEDLAEIRAHHRERMTRVARVLAAVRAAMVAP